MSSNVGLTTPRGSGTSGYVQRNLSLLKPRDPNYATPPAGYGDNGPSDAGFKQRQPDKQILEHDRRRAIEVQIIEERDRLEEENEKIAEENKKLASKNKTDSEETTGETTGETRQRRVELTEEEIEERLGKLRERLTNELEDELAGRQKPGPSREARHRDQPGYEPYPSRQRRPNSHEEKSGYKGRKQFKTYQVHEQAEAKIREIERLRKALGIRGEEQDPWDSGRREDHERRGRDRYADRDSSRRW
ncbi:pre-mRNA-splicing factor cwc21 [Trichophyton equinum CBS 127.97]|uniref:Pre-mRNA-splicing factor cwc21 n=1 Tax=Trichophyton equinum (strain ATCC MYA-4606 / CBS 127.97) TaxID=559882 RepID=F2PYS5_TRIEC|nr:pre-mRNA-splicing factor cwc21 [Trichophyton equinum CBS 127.97]